MLLQRCPLLETKCGCNANSTLLSGLTSWGLARTKVVSKVKGPIWDLVLYCKILLGEQIRNCFKKFIFHESTYKSPSYTSTSCCHSLFQFDWQPLYFCIVFFFWSVFSRIRSEYGEIQSEYLVRVFSPNMGKYRPEKLRMRTSFTQRQPGCKDCSLVEAVRQSCS